MQTRDAVPVPEPPAENAAFKYFGTLVNAEWPVLGALRFLLASVVMCSHLCLWLRSPGDVILWLGGGGGVGAVYCFFIVSGYSIAASIAREKNKFYQRRFIRIYPVYWFSLAITLFAWLALGLKINVPRDPYTPQTLPPPAYVMQFLGLPWIFTPSFCLFGQSWSLTCEIIYYYCAPWLVRLSTVAIAVLAAVSYYFFLIHNRWDWAWLYVWPTVCLLWVWLAGWLYFKYRDSLLAAGLLLASCILLMYPAQNVGRVDIFVVTPIVLIFARRLKLPKLISSIFTFLGDVSYPLYLIHITVIAGMMKYYGRLDHPGQGALYFTATVIVAALIHMLVERPARRRLYARLL